MPRLPRLQGAVTQRRVMDVFAGYNHNLRISDGEFYDTQNLTSAEFPMLASRKKRGVLTAIGGHTFGRLRAIIKKAGMFWVESNETPSDAPFEEEDEPYVANPSGSSGESGNGQSVEWGELTPANDPSLIEEEEDENVISNSEPVTGTLYANGYGNSSGTQSVLTGLQTAKETQLVSFGAYICIFPDNKYVNTNNLNDKGDMGARLTFENVAVTYNMCQQDGTIYDPQCISKQSTDPQDPENGDIWIDTTENAVKTWSSYTKSWSVIETVYTRVTFQSMGTIPTQFKEYDGVRISGLAYDDLNGSKILYAVGGREGDGNEDPGEEDYIVVVGIQDGYAEITAESITIERKIPKMDYVCEAQNRLWGCRYGNDGEGNVNEIYCCALGDFRNWEQYLGVSTDSWRASCGSDGKWTGCINYLGNPTFFKENRIHPVSVSSVGAHQIGDLPARGVQEGSHKSLAIVNETLYYKSRSGVLAWQGGMPVDVGASLGDVKYYEAAAGVFGQRYYISMRDTANAWNFFCYDVKTGIWMREDDLHVESFTAWGDELYARVWDTIVTINGTEGAQESRVDWYAETGVLYYEQSERGQGLRPVRYVSRFNIRLKMEKGARLRMFLEYDSSGVWEFSGEVRAVILDSFTLPVRPRRCDHFRIKLVGEGDCRIFSIARILEKGSDM